MIRIRWPGKLIMALLVLALGLPLWLRGPDGRPIMTPADWLESPAWLEGLIAGAREFAESPVETTPAIGAEKPGGNGGEASAANAGTGFYYRWQDATGLWHFSDEPPPARADELQPLALPDPANRLSPPAAAEAVEGGDDAGIGTGFDSSIGASLPAGISRESIETLLKEAHTKRMGEHE